MPSMSVSKDKQLQQLLQEERRRQREVVNLVASENIAPDGVMELSGSVFANKYAEGTVGRRYYPGTKVCDEVETLAQQRALKAFGLSDVWGVNVQAYSGAIANLAVYQALLQMGDTVLSMELSAGGHLSHGASVSTVSKLYNVVQYGVDVGYRIDYDQIRKLAKKHKPRLIVSGASAYPFAIDFDAIGVIAHEVGAYHVADISHYAGLIATGMYPSPFLSADVVTTTTHKSLMGPRGAIIFSRDTLSGLIDKAVFPGLQGGPHMETIAAMAHGLYLVSQLSFTSYAKKVIANASYFAKELAKRGCDIVGGGTQSHLLLVDVTSLGIDGKEAQERLEQEGILVNKNAIWKDESVQHPSAIRMGLYWMTNKGITKKELSTLAERIVGVLST